MRNKFARISDPNSFVSDSGDKFHFLYSPVISADGSMRLDISDKIDIQKEIDSFRDSTDMSYILNRLGIGDTSVLNGKTPHYGDFSQMPTNPAEFMQMAIDAEKSFLSLPLTVREQYGNDFRKWFADVGSASWLKNMESVLSVSDIDSVPAADPQAGSDKTTEGEAIIV